MTDAPISDDQVFWKQDIEKGEGGANTADKTDYTAPENGDSEMRRLPDRNGNAETRSNDGNKLLRVEDVDLEKQAIQSGTAIASNDNAKQLTRRASYGGPCEPNAEAKPMRSSLKSAAGDMNSLAMPRLDAKGNVIANKAQLGGDKPCHRVSFQDDSELPLEMQGELAEVNEVERYKNSVLDRARVMGCTCIPYGLKCAIL
eukprot:gnl/TRDRNA2_/TRDRNA2_158472_c0_seq1.p1 gnl/TRDRNA2_/TRDRNA2_158472_c0~~gnl/TRDRNA2_/TRDRNA2_158472_c0_seq1.p1  ORF type:complete len:222 (-),score=25.91 gnl/TRDRNA2_/TRDRNA2_158472_c0_seq1:154-756(-)